MECSKTVLPDDTIVVWNVREPVPGSTHLFKYRLFLARMVGASGEGFRRRRAFRPCRRMVPRRSLSRVLRNVRKCPTRRGEAVEQPGS
ncbi:hypothetical protein AGR2A_Lc20001 [Agrobacterium genomosp. 2 str. CFBP 5494]|uniref:Uncharacterized protein n=1 Tax=Agrobacterium genomosp. 2 str. CFBP 5494 TaxID=1183436 RepID=A0A9W5F5G1_9HYPH|nr:hypothetical protein AGR2A_Lc20001 [Agrobacterium genomosp. 2 str. CFBP 5494]